MRQFSRSMLVPALALLCLTSCMLEEPDPPEGDAGSGEEAVVSSHQQMLDELRKIADQTAADHPLLGQRRLNELRGRLATQAGGLSEFERVVLLTDLGRAELNANQVRQAIDHFEQALTAFARVPAPSPQIRDRFLNRMTFVLGTAYLRLGETENCCAQHTADSCIVPIQGTGIHRKRYGSEQAMRCFLDVLRRPTDEPVEQVKVHEPARWLLNVAAMTLGEFPDAVPVEFQVPAEFFSSEVPFPRFRNIYPSLGLDTFNLSGSVIVDDFDSDGDLDILTCTYDSTGQTQLFLNQDDGAFVERTEEWGLTGLYGGLTMQQGDFDNDGDVDVFIPRGAWLGRWGRHPNSLLRNDGNRFTDISLDAGLATVNYPSKTAAWADYDNDGDLDLFVGNESSGECEAVSQLFRNNGDSTFTDVAADAGLAEKLFTMGAVWGDVDGDRYPDLFVSAGGNNRLYHNNQDGTFTDIAAQAGVERPIASFPAWFWDYNNDGRLDLFVGASSGSVGILSLDIRGADLAGFKSGVRQFDEDVDVEMMALYEGDGTGAFRNVSAARGLEYPALPMGANYGDLNQDGFPDFYLGTGDVEYSELMPNVMFLNQESKHFANVTMAGGFGHLQKGHGVAFADFDSDGDLDVYMQMGGAFLGDKYNDALYENPGFGNRFIALKLVGHQSNRSAIGARIHVRIAEQGLERSVYHHVSSGGSFGANPLACTLGLGKAESIIRLEIYWPTSDRTQVWEAVEPDRAYRIEEDQDVLNPMELKRRTLGGPGRRS